MADYSAVEKRLKQKRQRRLVSYLAYASAFLVIVIIAFLAYMFYSSFVIPQAPQSPAEQEYALVQAMLKKEPQRPDLLLRLAQAEIEMGKTTDAVQHMQKAIKLRPYAPMLHYIMGQAYQARGDQKQAIKYFMQELKITQDKNELAAFDLGRIYYEQKNYDKALEYLLLASKRMSPYAELHYYLGLTYEAKKDKDRAIAEYTEALQYVPDHRDSVEALIRLTGSSGVNAGASGNAGSEAGTPESQMQPVKQ